MKQDNETKKIVKIIEHIAATSNKPYFVKLREEKERERLSKKWYNRIIKYIRNL